MLVKNTAIFLSSFLSLSVLSTGAFAAAWNDPGVIPVQSISDHAWRDANTGYYISTKGMPQPWNNTTQAGGTPTNTTAGAPANTNSSSSTNTNSGTSTNTPGTTTKSKLKTTGGAALGAVGLVTGTMGVVNSASGQQEHSWGDVLEGTVSGAVAASGGAAVLNAIPVVGNISYGVAVAAGAVIGGVVSGSQLFSETDCLTDPVTGKFTCCHTQFNQGERYAEIGEYMFCGDENNNKLAPGVRQCVQGDMDDESSYSETAASWFSGLWVDDFWTPECTVRICDNVAPQNGIESYIQYVPDETNYCWNWVCVDGFERSGNTCVRKGSNTPVNPGTTPESPNVNPYDELTKKIQAEKERIIQLCGHLTNS